MEDSSENEGLHKGEDLYIEESSSIPCQTIMVSKEEYDEYCKPWRNSLIFNILGK